MLGKLVSANVRQNQLDHLCSCRCGCRAVATGARSTPAVIKSSQQRGQQRLRRWLPSRGNYKRPVLRKGLSGTSAVAIWRSRLRRLPSGPQSAAFPEPEPVSPARLVSLHRQMHGHAESRARRQPDRALW